MRLELSALGQLLEGEPTETGDNRCDAFLAAPGRGLVSPGSSGGARLSAGQSLDRFWFPFNTAAARVDAIIHATVAFHRRAGSWPSAAP
jgi:hypothetical protein